MDMRRSIISSPTQFVIDGLAYEYEIPEKQDQGQAQQGFSQDDGGIMRQPDQTETGQALENLNSDEVDPATRMSSMDMRSRLGIIETAAILALDSMVGLGVYPQEVLTFTRQKKRLSVSTKGMGRDEIVRIVNGKQEREERKGSGFMEGMMGMRGR